MSQVDTINSAGVLFILLAFFLSTFGWLDTKSRWYYLLNLLGAALAFYGSLLIPSVPFAVLEGTWAVVALVGLLRTYKSST